VILLVLLLACPAAAFAGADNFRIDAVHSQVFVSASHDGYTHPSGRMHVKEGTFRFDADDWGQAQVNATVDVASLDMGDAPWTSKMLNSFFDSTHYPTAHFVSTRAEKTGDRSGVVHGNLTLLDKTRPIDLQVTFNRAGVNGYSLRYVAGFSATATFKRSLFGMTRDIPSVGDDVVVRMEIEGLRDADAKPPADAAPKTED
jgi:polyisoprenoid-binding protein YceI